MLLNWRAFRTKQTLLAWDLRSQDITTFPPKAAHTSPSPGEYLVGAVCLLWSWTSSQMEYPKSRHQSFLRATAALQNKGRPWHLTVCKTNSSRALIHLTECSASSFISYATGFTAALLFFFSPHKQRYKHYQPNAHWVETNPWEYCPALNILLLVICLPQQQDFPSRTLHNSN